jgi:transcription-repair coupling factor (superfamily II helicase)
MKPLSYLLETPTFPSFTQRSSSVYLSGLEGSSLSTWIAQQQREDPEQSLLILTKDAKSAEILTEDLQNWFESSSVPVLLYPGMELKPYEWRFPFGRNIEQRLRCVSQLLQGHPCIVVATLHTFSHKMASPKLLQRDLFPLQVEQEIDLESLRSTLLHMGFHENTLVEDLGQFSIRGDIIDVYPYLSENPIRLELWGDTIESIREFDIFTQRSIQEKKQVALYPVQETCFTSSELEEGLLNHTEALGESFDEELHRLIEKGERRGIPWQRPLFTETHYTLLDYMSPKTKVLIDEEKPLAPFWEQWGEDAQGAYDQAKGKGFFVAPPQELFVSLSHLENILQKRTVFRLSPLQAEGAQFAQFKTQVQTAGNGNLASIQDTLEQLREQDYKVYLLSPNQGQGERLKKLTQDLPVEDVLIGHLSQGFISETDRVAVFTDHQIFNKYSRQQSQGRFKKFAKGGVAIPNFEALSRGDTVVHQDYGIGEFVGIKRVTVENHQVDCLLLQYKDRDRLTLPVSDLQKIQKYNAKEGTSPTLSKLGGKAWEQLKQKTKKSVLKLAQDLIDLYAKRSAIKGFAFSSDTPMQKEFEEAFEYSMTPDQEKAVRELKEDMEQDKPMDRLICGDVGFGKTEVALRGVFKAICDKKQVAVLAPTTLLVSQHFASFQDRMSSWPVRIEYLNRFQSAQNVRRIKKELSEGLIDVIIGTHKLLGEDVTFHDLGLIVVDEEQKFGVKQKERLKKMRAEVDVLSLSATPIPRSMHMSMIGARDFSVILTPPRNRLPIQTQVTPYSIERFKEAMENELNRGGQCFFIHNRVSDLHKVTASVEEMMPQARVGMVHGQMNEKDLEQVMYAFIQREYDILVATSIVESGIDISNVNTIIIHNAHYFGLSQLFQMRGRVGRSGSQAYCLLVAPPNNQFTDEAKKRLYSLQKFTELGSGYQIAMRDLEIRGAGNILGTQQSGHIHALGFETYCRLLREAVQELQNKKELPPLDSKVDLSLDCFIPESYISDGLQRVSVYQKISRSEALSTLTDIEVELKDRFGPIPAPTLSLLLTAKARVAAQKLGFEKVQLEKHQLHLVFSEMHQPDRQGMEHLVQAFRVPFRFINETPLKIVVDLEKSGIQEQVQTVSEELEHLIMSSAKEEKV